MLSLVGGGLVSFDEFVPLWKGHSTGLVGVLLRPGKPRPSRQVTGAPAMLAEEQPQHLPPVALISSLCLLSPPLPSSLRGSHFYKWPREDNCRGAVASGVQMGTGHLPGGVSSLQVDM